MRRRYLTVPWGQLHVVDAGPVDGDAIVLLHQTPRSWDEFREVIGVLSDAFRVVAPDTPGMGNSDPHGAGGDINAYAEAVMHLIRDLDRPVHLVGHHTGGVIAIEVAAAAPDLVKSLVLSSTPWVDAAERERRARGRPPVDDAVPTDDGSHLRSLWDQRAAHYPSDRPDLLRRFLADAVRAVDPIEGHVAVGVYRMEERLPVVSCPVLLVGHRNDPFGMGGYEALHEQLPNAETTLIEQGSIPLEFSADEFAAHVRRFVSSI